MAKEIHIFKQIFLSLDVKNIVEETPSADKIWSKKDKGVESALPQANQGQVEVLPR